MAHGIDESDGSDDDEYQRDNHLDVDDSQARDSAGNGRAVRVEAMETERCEVREVDRRVGLEVPLDVPAIDDEEDQRDDQLGPCRLGRERDGRGDGEPVGDDEGSDVGAQHLRVGEQHVAGWPRPRLVQHDQAGHEHRERGEHERRAEDGADAYLVRVILDVEQDRDHGNGRFRQRGSDGGEHRSDRAFRQAELAAEPLDAVGEQLGAGEDDCERCEEDDEIHRVSLSPVRQPRRARRRPG